MLNFIYWPISAVLWFWHWLLSLVMDPAWGITWILAIVLLTWTLKALMVKPTISQIRSSRKMQEIQPKVQEIRAKYGNDQTKAAQEMQKVYKESGVRPMAGCLPVFVQIPMFVGLFHVLRSFDRTVAVAGGIGHPSGDPMSIEENANTANYIFKPDLVQQFLDAKIFDVPLVTNLRLNSPIVEGVTTSQAAVIIVPMIAVIAVMTHFNARMSLNRQEQRRAAGKTQAPQGQNAEMMQQQMAMMSKMMLWVMPAMLIFSGFIWPIGLLFYMMANTGPSSKPASSMPRWTARKKKRKPRRLRPSALPHLSRVPARRTTAPRNSAKTNKHGGEPHRVQDGPVSSIRLPLAPRAGLP